MIKLLKPYGYEVTRQVGSHIRLTTEQKGQHHITIPAHKTLTIGKVNAVVWDLVHHLGLPRKQVVEELFS